jgi:gluconolactonase
MEVTRSQFVETRFEIVDPRFQQLVLFNAQLERLFDGCRWLEGPVWFGDQQRLLVSDIPNDRILAWDDALGLTVYRHRAGFPNGQTRDRQGRLLTCSHGHRALLRTEHNGRVVTLVDSHAGQPLNTPNDVVVKSDGTIWFSDPLYGLVNDYEGGRRASWQAPSLYRFDPADGSLQAMTTLEEVQGPNGLAFSPDESLLYVVDTGAPDDPAPDRQIRVFDVRDGGLTLANGRSFHRVAPGNADGIRVDEQGHLWSSAGDGVHCIAADGSLLGKILTPKLVGNLCFGGEFGNRLFLCSWDAVYAIHLNTRGVQHPAMP